MKRKVTEPLRIIVMIRCDETHCDLFNTAVSSLSLTHLAPVEELRFHLVDCQMFRALQCVHFQRSVLFTIDLRITVYLN